MSLNMHARVLQEFDRVVEESKLALRVQLEATGDTGSLGTVNISRTFRATTSSDSAVRGFTLTFDLVESATPSTLSVLPTDDVVSV